VLCLHLLTRPRGFWTGLATGGLREQVTCPWVDKSKEYRCATWRLEKRTRPDVLYSRISTVSLILADFGYGP
jgi:hypothetical protein